MIYHISIYYPEVRPACFFLGPDIAEPFSLKSVKWHCIFPFLDHTWMILQDKMPERFHTTFGWLGLIPKELINIPEHHTSWIEWLSLPEIISFMPNPRICLLIGLVSISIFPVLVKWAPVSGITSAFYRMFFGFVFILPYVLITKKLTWPDSKQWLPIIACGLIFATDIAVWNLSIHYSNATQATLLTNLAPVWVGIGTFFFLPEKPGSRFWIGTLVALSGMVVLIGFDSFSEMKLDKGFALAILSGMLYATYMLVSKSVLNRINIVSFMTINMAVSCLYLFLVCLFFEQPLIGFHPSIWIVFLIQGLICQLLGWLAINYAVKKMDAKSVSLSLLSQALVTGLFAWAFIGEQVTLQMIVGGVIILAGIAITYQKKRVAPR